jgi:hypothetical protein
LLEFIWFFLESFSGFAATFATYSAPLLVLAVVGAAVGIYLACTVLELARIYLFRLLRVPALCRQVDVWLARLVSFFESRYSQKRVKAEVAVEEVQDVHTEPH